MIQRYNRRQLLGAIGALLGGCVCFVLAYLFFRHGPAFVASAFGYRMSFVVANLVAAGCLIAVAWTGYRQWKRGGGSYGYHESALYHDLGTDSAGALVTDFYAHRVTGPAYLVSQVFLAGPLGILKSWTLLSSRIAPDAGLNQKLAFALETLRAANKWQSIDEYPGIRREILLLAQIGEIDFSAHKGNPRIKANV